MKKLLQFKKIAFISTIFFICSLGGRAQIYVSPSGNDSNVGSELEPKKTIQAAIDIATGGQTVYIAKGTYNENVIINKNNITLIGGGSGANGNSVPSTPNPANHTLISGGSAGTGIQIQGIRNFITIKDLVISGFSQYGIQFANPNCTNITISNVQFENNGSTGSEAAVYINGSTDGVNINNCSFVGNKPRSIVIWNGFKKNISIDNNYIEMSNAGALVGIDLQDGTASGINVTNNTIIGTAFGDCGIGLMGLKAGSGSNIVSGNTIKIAGRYGLEIKNPAGTGEDNITNDGAIIIYNNNITREGTLSDTRDLAGIAVFRRSISNNNTNGNIDVPSGVVIRDNIVKDFIQPNGTANAEGFGIVAEGVFITIKNNTISNCDVPIQRQSGNPSGYVKNDVGDAEQTDNTSYFNRGNSPFSSAIIVSGNTSDGATPIVHRDVFAADTYFGDTQYVFNTDLKTTFATINLAVEAASAGNTLQLSENTFDELVVIDKPVTIDGLDNTKAKVKYTGTAGIGVTPALFKVTVSDIIIKNIQFDVDLAKIHSAILTSGLVSNINIENNNIIATRTALTGPGYGLRNAIALNPNIAITGAIHINDPNNSCSNYIVENNMVTGTTAGQNGVGDAFFRAAVQADRIDGYTFKNNTFNASVNHDIITRFLVGGDALITGNTFKGGGVEVSSSTNTAGKLTISNNNFDGAYSKQAPWAMLRLRINNGHREVIVVDNTFIDQKLAISLEDFRDVTLENNTITAGVDGFRLINFNTKAATTGPFSPLQQIGAKLYSNTFNGFTGATSGIAITFANFDQDGNNNYLEGTIEIGAVGKPNIFNNNIPTFIAINNSNGILTSDAGFKAAYEEYNDNYYVSTTGYWTKDIRADENNFFIDGQLRLPFDLTAIQRAELDDKIFDKKDDSNTGLVQYYFPVTNVTTGVKYASIQSAIDAASAGDEINTLPGEYLEDVSINKTNLKLIGPGANAATIKGIKGNTPKTTLSLAATGVVAEGFTVTREGNNVADWNNANGALNDQGVSMDANNTTARKLVITGNRNGLYINNRQNVLVEHCDIDNNRTGIQVVNNISGSIIRNNNITNNWTLGFLFLDIAGGQTTGIDVIKNKITGNWYSQIELRGANNNILNFGANNLGGTITVTNAPSAEPAYDVLIPTEFGGSSVAPSTPHPYIISGVNSDKVDYSVALADYTDTDPTIGFQPDSSIVWVYENSPVATTSAKLTSASKVVAPNGTIVIKDPVINSGGEISKNVTLDADVSPIAINGSLKLTGDINTFLTLAKPTTVTSVEFAGSNVKSSALNTFSTSSVIFDTSGGIPESGYVDGPLEITQVATSYFFPVGKNGVYTLLTVNGPTDAIKVEYFNTAPGDTENIATSSSLTEVLNHEYWNVESAGTANGVAMFTFDSNASGITTPNDIEVAYYGTANEWTSYGQNLVSADGNTFGVISADPIVALNGKFTFGLSTEPPLPVSLTNFTVKATTEGALINWSTATELSNDKFIIEKSLDGKTFSKLTEVAAKGSGNYSYTDKNLSASAYYRLVQVDLGGKTTVYNDMIRYVSTSGQSVSVYPNPTVSFVNINLNTIANDVINVKVTDGLGKQINNITEVGNQSIKIDLRNQKAGVYFIQLTKNNEVSYHKIVKH